jgi:hypothetical protein
MHLLALFLALIVPQAHAGKRADARAERAEKQDQDSHILGLEELSTLADQIIIGEVLATRVETINNGVYTIASVLVSESLRGGRDPLVEVRIPGGTFGDITFEVNGAPKLIAGYTVLLFLSDRSIVGWGQGAWVVEGGMAFRKKEGTVFDSPSLAHDWVEKIDPNEDYDILPLSKVRQTLR